MILTAESDAGDCYYIRDRLDDAQTDFGIRTAGAAGSCQADDTTNVNWSGWPDGS